MEQWLNHYCAEIHGKSIVVETIWVFPKIGVFPPKSSILIGFSIIFTIHFGIPLFLETSIYVQEKEYFFQCSLFRQHRDAIFFAWLYARYAIGYGAFHEVTWVVLSDEQMSNG